MQKTKQQLKDESVERFNIQFLGIKKDAKSLVERIDDLDVSNSKEISVEATNVLMGIRRDILMCIDGLNRIKRILKKGDTNE